MSLREQVLQFLASNPQIIGNNQRNQHMAEVIQSGDNAAGEQLANNLLQSWGISKEQFMQQFLGGGPK